MNSSVIAATIGAALGGSVAFFLSIILRAS
jgi:hypothetical protein